MSLGDITDPQSMRGHVCVVTGTAHGMGRYTAEQFARRGARVVGIDYDVPVGERAAAEIAASTGNPAVEFLAGDVADLDDVRRIAGELGRRTSTIDVLVNNAGVVEVERRTTPQGFEVTLATHFLGPFLLTQLLRTELQAAASPRVVNVCSEAHRQVRRIEWDDLNNERWRGVAHGTGFQAYARAKLFQQLFTQELARRWANAAIAVHGVSPGYFVATNVYRNMRGLWKLGVGLIRPIQTSIPDGARTQIFVATEPVLAVRTGGYWHACAPREPSPLARDPANAQRIWAFAQQATGAGA